MEGNKVFQLKFMFDWGSGVCLWSSNTTSQEKFGDYPIDTDDLPVSQELKEKIEYLINKHDEALNWNDPGGDLLWNDTQIQEFMNEAKKVYLALCDELGAEYEIEFYEDL